MYQTCANCWKQRGWGGGWGMWIPVVVDVVVVFDEDRLVL